MAKEEEKQLLQEKTRTWFQNMAIAAMETAASGDMDYILNFAMDTQTPGVWEILRDAAEREMN